MPSQWFIGTLALRYFVAQSDLRYRADAAPLETTATSARETLMNSSATNFVTALAIPAIAAFGGAAVVFSEFDDAPGGILIGYPLILGAVAFSIRAANQRR